MIGMDKLTPQQRFWIDPDAGVKEKIDGLPAVFPSYAECCKQEWYVGLHEVSDYIVGLITHHWPTSISILELGCGPGRNIAALVAAGFSDVLGIEISPRGRALARQYFPGVAERYILGPIEKVLPDCPDVDLIFTSGVLMHLPPESEFVFPLMAKKARLGIMTNEVEGNRGSGNWHPDLRFIRNYKEIFESLGWEMVAMTVPGISQLSGSKTRIFVPEGKLFHG